MTPSTNSMTLQNTVSPSFDLLTFGCNDYDHLNGLVLLFNIERNVRILVPRVVFNDHSLATITDEGTGKLVPSSYEYIASFYNPPSIQVLV